MWNQINIDVDIKKKNHHYVEVNQADDVCFNMRLYNNGQPLNLVDGEDTIIVNYANANGTVTGDSNIGRTMSKSGAIIYLPRNCTNSAGTSHMQVTINTNNNKTVFNKQITSFPIDIKVNKSIVDGQEVSTNVNSMLSSLNSANIKGQQVIKNITETATKYPPSSQLYADVEDLKVREYGGENLLQDSGFLSGNIGSGFPWNVYNSNTTAITAASDSAYSGKSVRITSTTGEAGIKQYIIYNRASTVKDFKNAYTASFRIYGIKGTVIKVALSNAQMKTYTIKAENTWEDVVITFDTNINNWDKGFCIVSSSATNFYLQDVALWEGRNAFSFKYNSQECLYDRIRISGQDVLAITKSGKYAGVGCTNNPFGNNNEWAYYDIDVHSTTYKKIIARSYNRNITYENTLNNGTWTGWQSPLLRAFPVGSIKLSNNNTNPGTYLLGSTWTLVGQGLTLAGVGTGKDKNNVSKTFNAGANTGEYQHMLKENENNFYNSSNEASNQGTTANGSFSGRIAVTAPSQSAFNVTQPTYGVYIWLRTV